MQNRQKIKGLFVKNGENGNRGLTTKNAYNIITVTSEKTLENKRKEGEKKNENNDGQR